MVVLQVIPNLSSMENYDLCKVFHYVGQNLKPSFYQVLPNFVSLAERYQIIVTAENYTLESDFHQIAHSYK